MSSHINDTPRTDAEEYESQDEPITKLGSVDAEFARTLERELNAANDRIQRLEKAGEDLAVCGYFMGFEDELKAWRKAVKDSQ